MTSIRGIIRKVSFRNIVTAIVILGMAAVGTFFLVGSHASAPYASVSAYQGSVSGSASKQTNCSGAVNNTCVLFGQPIPMDGNVALALSASGTPFSPTSFWNTPIPDNAPVNVNNAAYILSLIHI